MILFTDHSPGLGITQVQASAGLAELGQPPVPTLDFPETLEVWQALRRGLGGEIRAASPLLAGRHFGRISNGSDFFALNQCVPG
jgi:hypothetical protein